MSGNAYVIFVQGHSLTRTFEYFINSEWSCWKLNNQRYIIVHWDRTIVCLRKESLSFSSGCHSPALPPPPPPIRSIFILVLGSSAHLICKCVANVWQTQQKYVEQASFSYSSLSTKDNVLVDELHSGIKFRFSLWYPASTYILLQKIAKQFRNSQS